MASRRFIHECCTSEVDKRPSRVSHAVVHVVQTADQLDFRQLVQPGDMVVWGQGCAEPRALTGALLAQREQLGGIRCMVGLSTPATRVRPEHGDSVSFLSYTGSGVNNALHQDGNLDILPCHYSQLPGMLTAGPHAADVVLLQVAPPGPDGRYSFGLANEYLSSAVKRARTVVVEINESVPRTAGPQLALDDIDVMTYGADPPAPMPAGRVGDREHLIASHIADIVEDGSTLQVGVGALPDSVLAALTGHRHLGIHSGLITDGVMYLMECGAVDNSAKGIDDGVSVTGLVIGSSELFEFVNDNPAVRLRETEYIHNAAVLASLNKLVSINSALEVDLTGQVNAEVAGGRYIGAVGGAIDFARGARASIGGLAIIALPSTARHASRIVAQLSGPVSTPRADVSIVVTEFGVADLRGRTMYERHELLLAIAHPDHQDALLHAWSTVRNSTTTGRLIS
jgi:acetyl-CoA hydrolase